MLFHGETEGKKEDEENRGRKRVRERGRRARMNERGIAEKAGKVGGVINEKREKQNREEKGAKQIGKRRDKR